MVEGLRERAKRLILMVGAEGFEPPTLCSQSRCATRLRYAPISKFYLSGGLAQPFMGLPKSRGGMQQVHGKPAKQYDWSHKESCEAGA